MTGVIAECVTGTEEARWTWVEALTPQHVGRKYSEMLPAEDLARCFSWRHWLKLEADRLCCREVLS